MNTSEQDAALKRLREALANVLSCLPLESPGSHELGEWLEEFERGDLPSSRARAIALSLRGRAVELERQTKPPTLPEAAFVLRDAAEAVLTAF